MPRACTVCRHPERDAVEAALIRGEANRAVAARFGLSPQAIRRHKQGHLLPALAAAEAARRTADAAELIADLHRLREDAARIAVKAEEAKSYPAACSALREQARIIEILLKVAGELASGPTVNINAGWVELRTLILGALDPYPEARQRVAEVLRAA